MAINKKLIHFQTMENFDIQLSAGNILDTSICFIKDAKKIWTHGKFYDCNSDIKQDTLVSGTNIKTINGESILGEGNLTVEGGSSDANVQAVDTSETLEDVNTSTYVKYVAQTLTEAQKTQARINIGVDLSSYATTEYVNAQIGDINSILTSIINQ